MVNKAQNRTDEILDAVTSGKHRLAFDLFYKSCWPKVLKHIQKNNGSKAEAEDIFHDALIVLFKQVKLGKYNREHDPDGYVFVISRNLWLNHAKRQNRSVPLDSHDPPAQDDIHQSIVSEEWREQVMALMTTLGERCRELLSLTIFHNLRLTDIMEKMGFGSIDVVKTKHYKCKQRLIKAVKENVSIKEYLKHE